MNPTGKKLISLFLVFSLMMLSVNLYAKERRGAKLLIIKKNGQQVEGELITVKPNSLLLLNKEGKDESVGIAEIKVIKIKKKSKALLGALIGGPCAWFIYGFIGTKDEDAWFSYKAAEVPGALVFGTGLLLGGLIGAGADKTIQIEGRLDSEVKEVLEKLRKKARIRDYQ